MFAESIFFIFIVLKSKIPEDRRAKSKTAESDMVVFGFLTTNFLKSANTAWYPLRLSDSKKLDFFESSFCIPRSLINLSWLSKTFGFSGFLNKSKSQLLILLYFSTIQYFFQCKIQTLIQKQQNKMRSKFKSFQICNACSILGVVQLAQRLVYCYLLYEDQPYR